MMHLAGQRLATALVLGAALSLVGGCERNASGLTEWTPADHDHQSEPRGRRRAMATAQQKADRHSAPSQKNQVIGVTWAKQCATCHGRRGRGDGPSSTMVKARDLTDPEFQASVSDEQLAKIIREGKDKMPAFNLPDSVIEGLVEHVRGFVRKRRAARSDDEGRPETDDEEEAEADEDDEEEAETAESNAPAAAAAPHGAAANAPASAAASPARSAGHGAADAPARAQTSASNPGSPTPAPQGAASPAAPKAAKP